MPVASSSRRRTKSRVQADSDIEDGPTQRIAQEDVDEDVDQEPRRVVKKEKRAANSKGKSRASEAQAQQHKEADDDDDDEDDEDDRIDVANFADQPLDKSNLVSMRGLAKDWDAMKQAVHRSNAMVADVAVALADALDGEDGQKGLAELERLLKELLDVESEMQINHDVIENLSQQVATGEEITNVIEQYQANAQKDKDSYTARTMRQKYAKNETYKNFKQSIYEIENPGQAMPPVTEFMPKESGDDSDDDDDLEMGAVTQDYKCPLTLRPLEDPVTSDVCGHSFSRDAIREYFGNDQGSRNCPASGCREKFRITNCKTNKELAKKLRLHERRLKKRAAAMEAEEVVE
ncbi:hypothetical protein GYMLUDRAFT_254920 [Collybiopsis luxurians FD-317 M1]|nr:hypothetical protein GYMLUDRAFT_254920 [Collybiopsis luxurians FD-317 M1]